tara:strand:+ start:165 stop:341 length:177 start_codon:yes stop_codon:yes gene_type:complete
MEFLIAAAFTCSDLSVMIERVNGKKDLSPSTRADIVEIYKNYYRDVEGLECHWDAKAD